MTLVGVGHALADAFAFVGEDVPKTLGLHPGSFNRVPDYRMRAILATLRQKSLVAGGSAANTVKLAARLGMDTHFVGQCGHDEAGHIFEAELLGAGVKTQLRRSDAPTGLCVTFLSPGPGRTVATFRAASGGLSDDLLSPALLAAADTVVLEGYLLDEPEVLTALLDRCRAAGKAVAFDTADTSLVSRHLEALQAHLKAGAFRYFFVQEADAASITGKDAEGSLEDLAAWCPTVVLRREDRGWLIRHAGKVTAVPLAGAAAVDATGSPDAFQAGFFWALDRGWTPDRACRAGSLAAACVAEQPGTRVDPPRWDRLRADLAALD